MNLIPNRKSKSFKATMFRAVAGAVVTTSMVGTGLMIGSMNATVDAMPAPGGEVAPTEIERPSAPHAPVTVFEKHKNQCWTSDMEPKAELPGHAIVQFNDGKAVYSGKPEIVDAAFNEALASIGFAEHRENLPFANVIALCV